MQQTTVTDRRTSSRTSYPKPAFLGSSILDITITHINHTENRCAPQGIQCCHAASCTLLRKVPDVTKERKSAYTTFSEIKRDKYIESPHKVATVSVFPLLEMNKLALVLKHLERRWGKREEGRKKWREEDAIQRKGEGKILTGKHILCVLTGLLRVTHSSSGCVRVPSSYIVSFQSI